MNRVIKVIYSLWDELRDIWTRRRERLGVILYQLDGFALAVVTLGRCAIGDTISSTAWRLEQAGKFWGRLRKPIDWVFLRLLGEVNHCQAAHRTFLRITGAGG